MRKEKGGGWEFSIFFPLATLVLASSALCDDLLCDQKRKEKSRFYVGTDPQISKGCDSPIFYTYPLHGRSRGYSREKIS